MSLALDVFNDLYFPQFLDYLEEEYNPKVVIDYSSCSLKPGHNVKFKKSGKTLCTCYPEDGFHTVMIVIGQKQLDGFLELLPSLSQTIREYYQQYKDKNESCWLMIPFNNDQIFLDIKQLIELRKQTM